jgi:hypothetical protein
MENMRTITQSEFKAARKVVIDVLGSDLHFRRGYIETIAGRLEAHRFIAGVSMAYAAAEHLVDVAFPQNESEYAEFIQDGPTPSSVTINEVCTDPTRKGTKLEITFSSTLNAVGKSEMVDVVLKQRVTYEEALAMQAKVFPPCATCGHVDRG